MRMKIKKSHLLISVIAVINIQICIQSSISPGIDWSQWWTYDGISGPKFWGEFNPQWAMCKDGRRQSPINIDPQTLLYDPNLTPFNIDKVQTDGVLVNTGHSVEWRSLPSLKSSNVTTSSTSNKEVSSLSQMTPANVTGGPLSYTYTLTHVRLHFGRSDGVGSEHTLNKLQFPAELQIFGYNSQLYRNYTHALGQVYGIVAFSILVKLGDSATPEFQVMLESLTDIKYGGTYVEAPAISLSGLLPSTEHYMTYEGSLTEPSCHETVTWIVPNKPIYINHTMMKILRSLRQGQKDPLSNAPIANNFRPVQTAHHRTIRTNISPSKDAKDIKCLLPSPRISYKAGTWLES